MIKEKMCVFDENYTFNKKNVFKKRQYENTKKCLSTGKLKEHKDTKNYLCPRHSKMVIDWEDFCKKESDYYLNIVFDKFSKKGGS